ncbi:MAG: CSLREA domain-containing protein [Pseudomonadota bacterium]
MITRVQRFSRRLCVAGAAAALLLFVQASPAATIIVTTTVDGFNPADGCSLREALVNADTNSKSGSVECSAGSATGSDVIILPPLTFKIQGSSGDESDPAQGDIDIFSDITILGGGQQFTILDADGGGRIFDVHAGAQLTLRGLQLQDGFVEAFGGGVAQGGAIRVNALGALTAVDIGVLQSRVSALSVNGVGGAIYVAPGAQATIDRSELTFNEALGVGGSGAGIYCDGCTLSVTATTLAHNQALAAGGGLYLAGGSVAELDFVTAGFNAAATGAGIYSDTDFLSLFGDLFVDNGYAMPGDDVECAAGPFVSADYTFIEYPRACAPMTGIQTRSDLPAQVEAQLLQSITMQRFDGQASSVLQWSHQFYTVPGASCPTHIDQIGQQAYQGAASSDAGCDIGAFERPRVAINPMVLRTQTGGAAAPLSIGLFGTPTVDTTVEVVALGGVGEGCDYPGETIVFPASTYADVFFIDPDTLFSAPVLNRRYRICELQARVVSGDPSFVGAATGVVRVNYQDTIADSAGGISVPGVGTYLQFGTVAVGHASGLANIYFRSAMPTWNITGAAFTGADAGRFLLGKPGEPVVFPFAIPPSPGDGINFPVQCLGGAPIGDYDAVLEMTTDHPDYPTIIYGVRCRVAHQLSFTSPSGRGSVTEGDGRTLLLRAALDSPSQLTGPFSFTLHYLGGTATLVPDLSDSVTSNDVQDFLPFTPAPHVSPYPARTLTINPGEESVLVEITVLDDLEFSEPSETIETVLDVPYSDQVELSGSGTVTLRIADNDVPSEGLQATMTGIPRQVAAGMRLNADISLQNTSDVAILNNADVTTTVDAPVRVLSYVVEEVFVTCKAHYAYLERNFSTSSTPTLADIKADQPCDPIGAPNALFSSVAQGATPAYESALHMVVTSHCSITGEQRTAACSFSDPVPPGTLISLRAIIEMARMEEAPQVDYPGEVSLSARGRSTAGWLEDSQESPYVINGRVKDSGGGLPLPLLLVAGLLALRGYRKSSTGREAR